MGLFTPPHILSPQKWNHRRIGLLGGSFNPPHKGHVHISEAALHMLGLDCIWWLVTPQNPLKKDSPADFEERMRACRKINTNPRIVISDLERQLATNITYETISALKARFPKTGFIWLSGMDNALTIHHWQRWRDLLSLVPTAHITRMPATSLIQNCPLRQLTTQRHIVMSRPGKIPLDSRTSYWLLHKNMMDISSSQLRQKRA